MAEKNKADNDEVEAVRAYAEGAKKFDRREEVRARAEARDLLRPEELDARQADIGEARRTGGPPLDEEPEQEPSPTDVPPQESKELEE